MFTAFAGATPVSGSVIGPRQWTKIEALITQADGKPTVAPESDKRPALDMKPQFEDLTVSE
nr:DUF2800 domain-containing protein [Acinetobacter pittii]